MFNSKEKTSPEIKVEIGKLVDYLINNNFPFFAKEKLYLIFSGCTFEGMKFKNIVRVKFNGTDIGYLVNEDDKYMLAPKKKTEEYRYLGEEYLYENNQAVGFFYTTESYLDVAL